MGSDPSQRVMVPISKKMGKMIKKARVECGFSQRELALKLGLKSSQNVSNWERGISSPTFEDYVGLSKILNISERVLLDFLKEEQSRILNTELKKVRAKDQKKKRR